MLSSPGGLRPGGHPSTSEVAMAVAALDVCLPAIVRFVIIFQLGISIWMCSCVLQIDSCPEHAIFLSGHRLKYVFKRNFIIRMKVPS